MSAYQFAPFPDILSREANIATWVNAFTDEDIANIINLGEHLDLVEGHVSDGKRNEIRSSKISWIELNEQSNWLYNKMSFITTQLNARNFQFDLWGFNEHFQYTVYNGDESNHYTWHMDKGVGESEYGVSPRKLSIVLQLSDPSEYEGGNFEIFTRDPQQYGPETVEKQKGLVIAFPSWVMHRVTPVTKGIRRSLVIWVTGPKFR